MLNDHCLDSLLGQVVAMQLRNNVVDQRQHFRNHLVLIQVHQLVHVPDPHERISLDFSCDTVTGSHVLE